MKTVMSAGKSRCTTCTAARSVAVVPSGQGTRRTGGRALTLERRADGVRVTIDRRVPAGPVTVLGSALREAGSEVVVGAGHMAEDVRATARTPGISWRWVR